MVPYITTAVTEDIEEWSMRPDSKRSWDIPSEFIVKLGSKPKGGTAEHNVHIMTGSVIRANIIRQPGRLDVFWNH